MFLDLDFQDDDQNLHSSNYSPFKVQGLLEGMVNVIITDKRQKLVDMRELHEVLKVNSPFDIWIKRRIEAGGFEEEADFSTFLLKSTGGRPRTEFYFLLNSAKEVALMENNEMGRMFRKYFIEMEHVAQRFLGKITRRSLTDAIREKWKPIEPWKYGVYTNELIYKQIFNRTKNQLVFERKIEGNLRDELTKEELLAVETVEQEAAKFIDEYNLTYDEVLRLLNKKYRSKILLSNRLQHQKQSFFLH